MKPRDLASASSVTYSGFVRRHMPIPTPANTLLARTWTSVCDKVVPKHPNAITTSPTIETYLRPSTSVTPASPTAMPVAVPYIDADMSSDCMLVVIGHAWERAIRGIAALMTFMLYPFPKPPKNAQKEMATILVPRPNSPAVGLGLSATSSKGIFDCLVPS